MQWLLFHLLHNPSQPNNPMQLGKLAVPMIIVFYMYCRYQIVCELIDRMVDSSIHLRHILGLPAREFTRVSCSDTQMQEEQVVLSPGELRIWRFLDCCFPVHIGKDKKDKNEKKAAFNTASGKDKKEGKQKLQASKEEVSQI